ncbi:hypothetical protein SAMD00024442_1_23 [Candidatus Symbiothrix dinenymphae]|nr:hypothetical protein SAMD00024442_1_23 [Candidatus Symbiothrix dinenymphae]
MTSREKYAILLQNEPTIPLYVQDWWLDCVCGAKLWDVLLYENDKGEIEAAMPIYTPCKGVITMPPFTQSMGIWFNPAFEKSTQQGITDYFIRQLTCHCGLDSQSPASFLVGFDTSFTDCQPFSQAGYTQTTRTNYILPLSAQLSNVHENTRRNIQKAHKKFNITIQKEVPVDAFLRLNAMVYERQNRNAVAPNVLKKVIKIALQRGQGAIWGAYDAEGKLYSAVFLVWQSNRAYYIAAGSDPALRHSGAPAAVLWQAILDVAEHAKTFDFCGSMLPGVARFFYQFGAIPTSYLVISKGNMNLWLRIRAKLNKIVHNL